MEPAGDAKSKNKFGIVKYFTYLCIRNEIRKVMSKFIVKVDADYKSNPLVIISKKIKVSEIYNGYVDNSRKVEGGIRAMGGKLDIRPKWQRSYVVGNDKTWKAKLINSVLNGRPTGLIYFGVVANSDVEYVNVDGQQRMITICEFIKNAFPIDIEINGVVVNAVFDKLPYQSLRDAIMNYELDVRICNGDEESLLEWFRTINQPSSILTEQEIRNTSFVSEWLESAKAFFSLCDEKDEKLINDDSSKYYYKKYMTSDPLRQGVLETVLDWAGWEDEFNNSSKELRIYNYMLSHYQSEDNADNLINYYKKVIDWARATFLDGYEKDKVPQSMKSVDWGRLYHTYGNQTFDTKYVSKRLHELLDYFQEVNKCDGFYEWILTGEDPNRQGEFKIVSRNFDKQMKENAYRKQGGIDPIDGQHYEISEMEAHHIKAWYLGGKREEDNCVLLCKRSHDRVHAGEFKQEDVRALKHALLLRVKAE